MSRIGREKITVPQGVEVKIEANNIIVKGPKGELNYKHLPQVAVKMEDNIIEVTPTDDSREARGFWGLTRTLINNMVIGVSKGYEKQLEIIGVGYKSVVQGNKIILSLGFSHKIEYEIPEGIKIEQKKEKNEILTISGISKELVGAVAAKIRSYKKPEPYKGKGIRYVGEYVQRKEGKAVSKGE